MALTITEFLQERISTDEAFASLVSDQDISSTIRCAKNDGALTEYDALKQSDYVNRYNAERVLAECAAKRAILAFDQDHQIWEPRGFSSDTAAEAFTRGGPKDPYARHVTRILAALYNDHPDYQQEWAL